MGTFPNAKIYSSHKTYIGLKDEHMNLMYILPEFAFNFTYDDNIVELMEGNLLIHGIEVEMIVCNGHSNDCQSWIIEENLFTGDGHIPFAKVFTKSPTSIKSLLS